jgi:hypothetical protein
MVGNLADLPFDGQTAITQRGLRTGPACHYVGNARFLPGTDPERFDIGGEPLPVRPYAGPKTEFLALAPWVMGDAPRPELQRMAADLSPDGNGALENDYLETAVAADLPFPPRARRGSGNTAPAAAARQATMRLVSVRRRVWAGRAIRLRFRTVVGYGRGSRPISRALIRVGTRRVRTNRRGFATMVVRFARPGRVMVRASHPGLRGARWTIRVLPVRRR